MHRRRTAALALVLVLAGAACASGGEPAARPDSVDEAAPAAELSLHVTGAELVSDHRALGPLDETSRDGVMAVLQRTFEATVVRPATTGRAGNVAKLFTPDAVAQAVGVDRGALFDEGLPRVPRLVADQADVWLTGLEGDAGPALIVARIAWDVRSPDARVRVQRVGELTLVPAFGSWFVGSYGVVTARTLDGAVTTTTARSR